MTISALDVAGTFSGSYQTAVTATNKQILVSPLKGAQQPPGTKGQQPTFGFTVQWQFAGMAAPARPRVARQLCPGCLSVCLSEGLIELSVSLGHPGCPSVREGGLYSPGFSPWFTPRLHHCLCGTMLRGPPWEGDAGDGMVAAGRGSLPQGHLEGHQVSTALAATPAVPTPTPLTPLPAGLAPMSSPVSSDGEHCLRLAILSAAPGLPAASSPCPAAHLLHPSACAPRAK